MNLILPYCTHIFTHIFMSPKSTRTYFHESYFTIHCFITYNCSSMSRKKTLAFRNYTVHVIAMSWTIEQQCPCPCTCPICIFCIYTIIHVLKHCFWEKLLKEFSMGWQNCINTNVCSENYTKIIIIKICFSM